MRGLERMVEDDRYCIDVLTQIAAVNTALESLAFRILDDHVRHCVAGALASGDEADSATVMQFARDLGVSFDVLHDRAGAIRRLYQTTGVPESFVIERDGVIVKKVIGPAEWDGPVNEVLIRKLIDAR